ncbi:MAG: DUF6340 family protein [Bacteroidota bacterium]
MRKIVVFAFFLSLLASCTVRENLYVDVVKPSQNVLPIANRSFTFIPVDGDFDNDSVVDTLLCNIFLESMVTGFQDDFLETPFLDTSAFYPRQQLIDQALVRDSVSGEPLWPNLRKLALRFDADYLIVLDDVTLQFNEEVKRQYYDGTRYYQKIRKIHINAQFTLYEPFVSNVVETYNYKEEFYWDGIAILRADLERELPPIHKSVREAAYWTARDYIQRFLPKWEQQSRSIFVAGNQYLKTGYNYFQQGDLEKANEQWQMATKDKEAELASRAWSNLAYIAEIEGNIVDAMKYAMNSYKVKPKTRTKEYIEKLKERYEANKRIEQYFGQ